MDSSQHELARRTADTFSCFGAPITTPRRRSTRFDGSPARGPRHASPTWRSSSCAPTDAGTGVPDAEQRGDNAALEAWLRTGARDALDTLARAQAKDDYAAWKFGYVGNVLDVIVDARAAGNALLGCDMPRSLQDRLGPARAAYGAALRELHCALAVGDATRGPGPRRVAVLWGAQHVGQHGFRRFVHGWDVLAVRVVGGRPATSADAVTTALAEHFDLLEPLLLPPRSDVDEAIVVLPDPAAAAHVE